MYSECLIGIRTYLLRFVSIHRRELFSCMYIPGRCERFHRPWLVEGPRRCLCRYVAVWKENILSCLVTLHRLLGSGCGSVGRAVASDPRGPRFEFSHWQTFKSKIYLFTVNCIEKTKIKKKRPGMAHFYKNYRSSSHIKCTYIGYILDERSKNTITKTKWRITS